MIKRIQCVVCGGNVDHVNTLQSLPVFMGCINTDDVCRDVLLDLNIDICNQCGGFQTKELPDYELVYKKTHNSGTVGNLWKQHHKKFAEFINDSLGTNIIEIGGGHGFLAQSITKKHKHIKWTIVEKNVSNVYLDDINIVNKWFDENYIPNEMHDTIIMSHVFEHLYNPQIIIEHIYNILPNHGKVIISLPNLYSFLKNKNATCINFEHTFYIIPEILEYVFSLHKFKLIKQKNFYEHSIFFVFEKTNENIEIKMPNLYNINIKLLQEYFNYFYKIANNLNLLDTKKENSYIFGAHIFSQYLFSCGLDQQKFNNILDNDKNKHNMRLYGTNLVVKNPYILKNIDSPIISLYAGVYSEEIKKDLLLINENIRFT